MTELFNAYKNNMDNTKLTTLCKEKEQEHC